VIMFYFAQIFEPQHLHILLSLIAKFSPH